VRQHIYEFIVGLSLTRQGYNMIWMK